jgi:hypothetical protein
MYKITSGPQGSNISSYDDAQPSNSQFQNSTVLQAFEISIHKKTNGILKFEDIQSLIV